MSFIDTIKSMLADPMDQSVSSKRVIIVVCVLLMAFGYLGNILYHFAVDTHMYDSIMYVVLGATGSTSVEKFVPKPS